MCSSDTASQERAGMDEDRSSYRPISNLPFLSNLIEKVMARRIEHHIQLNDLHDRYQSAHRKDHSTETDLIKVHSDICDSLDEGSMAALVLCYTFGTEHEALSWMKSYLSDRFQHIFIAGSKSADSQLDSGVPQGSVLGPVMYCTWRDHQMTWF